jgi:hypothetical protein
LSGFSRIGDDTVRWFASRGVVCPGAAVTAALSAHAAQASPGVLAGAVSGAALKAAATGTGELGIANLIQIITAMKLKAALLTAGFPFVIALVAVYRVQ